jgi:hypothetical protein
MLGLCLREIANCNIFEGKLAVVRDVRGTDYIQSALPGIIPPIARTTFREVKTVS